MGTTIRQIFNEFNINEFKKVKWGEFFSETRQGVYIVSTSNDSDKNLGLTNQPLFDDQQLKLWINKLPKFQIDGELAKIELLKRRLSDFWIPDESILYIGKAPKRKNGSGISKRVTEYFNTEIGDGSPHSGGQWIKVLKNLNSFSVYFGICDNPAETERNMLDYFMDNVSKESESKLFDKILKIPFANIKHRGNKNHGMKNQRL